MIVLIAQHRMQGLTLILMAIALSVSVLCKKWRSTFRVTAFVLMILLGIELLSYTEGRFLFAAPSPHATHATQQH